MILIILRINIKNYWNVFDIISSRLINDDIVEDVRKIGRRILESNGKLKI
jgi:hypothetical protein